MKTYPIVRLPDDEAYRWWKVTTTTQNSATRMP